MTVQVYRWPRVGGTILRAVAAPFALGFAVSLLALAALYSPQAVFIEGLYWGFAVVMIGMPIAGYLVRAALAPGHPWLGFVSAAVGATVPILWALAQRNHPMADLINGTLTFAVPAWLALALGYGAYSLVHRSPD
jgi:hypothetical protein